MRNISNDIKSLCRDFAGAARITANGRSCARLMTDFFLSRLMRFIALPTADTQRQIRLKGGGQLTYRLNRGDMYTLHEVWVEEMYRLPFAVTPALVVDLGANIGLTSLWIAKQYGCARLIGVEPSASNAALARQNLAYSGVPTEIIEAAAGAEDGTGLFDAGVSPTNGRIVEAEPREEGNLSAERQQRVPVLSMNTILQNVPQDMPIDLMKIDIEGGEQSLLTGNTDWLRRVQTMLIEFHPALVEYQRLVTILNQYGLKRVSALITDAGGDNTMEIFVSTPEN